MRELQTSQESEHWLGQDLNWMQWWLLGQRRIRVGVLWVMRMIVREERERRFWKSWVSYWRDYYWGVGVVEVVFWDDLFLSMTWMTV
jgi:hypothetical protein